MSDTQKTTTPTTNTENQSPSVTRVQDALRAEQTMDAMANLQSLISPGRSPHSGCEMQANVPRQLYLWLPATGTEETTWRERA